VRYHSYATVLCMTLSEALSAAMTAAGLKDEDVAVRTKISVWTVRDLRLGRRTAVPRAVTLEALKREVPGLAERLGAQVA